MAAGAIGKRVQLNRLSKREVDDAKMATVFGKDEQKAAAAAAKRDSMKVNPLYDQDGTIEVPSNDAQRARTGSIGADDDDEEAGYSSRKSKKPFKKSKRKTNSDEEDNDALVEPKIAYSKNFRFKGPTKQNGALNGQAGNKKVTTAGRIMPSRISRNAIPGSQIMASLSGNERPKPKPAYQEEPQLSNQDEIEASQRRSEIKKKWRLVVALILIILVFALILVIVLYFAAKGS
ncbi:uncharacterized protein [Amphiura filiformis]|uniref:uncharacterized protein isoform X2 n=1 Tax=Amphiura filiformis TaxID=82378 RepID=UPI003B2104AB